MIDIDRQNNGAIISIVIVNYRVPEYLRETIRSIYQADGGDAAEIIVVDNASEDRSQELITGEFPAVRWIQLKHNIGFGKACNVGVQNSTGEYVLLLNPDTMIAANTLTESLSFMRSNPRAGLMGPKILNPDGTLQSSCKRGFPTPSATFYYFVGLGRLFPRSRRFGQYNLTYLNPDEPARVDAVSGSFMFMPRSLYLRIGGFDERFFMYGEDLDLCYRICESGYEVWYYPKTQIIHRKGKSSSKRLLRSRIAFYEAMVLFSRKYRSVHRGFFPGWLVFFAIIVLSCTNIALNLVRHFRAIIIDVSIINTVLCGTLLLRFGEGNPYLFNGFWYMLGIHGLLSMSFLFMYAYNGIYGKRHVTFSNRLWAGLLATLLFSAGIYFVKSFAVSRIAFAVASIISSFLLAGWREIAPQLVIRFRRAAYPSDKIILVGNGPLTDKIISNIEKNHTGTIVGVVWSNGLPRPGEYAGYPVLGTMNELSTILPKCRFDLLIIATSQPWYSHIIELLSTGRVNNLTIRWVPHDLTVLPAEQLPDVIPLRDFSV